MRAALVGLVLLLPSTANAALVPFPSGGYRLTLAPGDATDFNLLHVSCAAGRVTVAFGEAPDKTRDTDVGRGAQQAAFADCSLADGTVVRVKAGYEFPPEGWGECGADPGRLLSVWIGRRKVISKKKYVPYCSEVVLKSMEIDAAGVSYCTLSKADPDPYTWGRKYSELSDTSICVHAAANESPEDAAEFVGDLHPGFLSGHGLCAAMIDPKSGWRVLVPGHFAQPHWREVPPHNSRLDEKRLGFNADTFANPTTRAAVFDLENSGRVGTVYQHDEENHWFAGSALAIDQPGILDVPFDAHDWERSRKSGIYAYVYDHVTVFFDRARTYLLLDPENLFKDPRIVTLRGGKETEICKLKRQQENF